ncbi:chemotaxis protein CheB [Thalassobaculum sp. OXR-137]|uniref:chemotaxis protein CheB n=1 Tax=Thalassobaculum sp. OXR-137 TaxID=3100173 RepID=UPI002AC9E2F5|nr:chemotaxis protein CheB [Thalassobaculum sp. OXR-137]WPZ35003.1 chemotaxis protein CheB [Thalassobaculum sp. OXR-137]
MPDEEDDIMTSNGDHAPPEPFPIVAIGASAGGLDAFRQFLEAMPDDCGMAFLLIQHLDPNHESLMAELLARHTALSVQTATDGTPLAPNTVYVIPPNCYLRVIDLTIMIERPVAQRGVRMPIDYCFRSLAETLHERAVGIVLTGTASDGTAGLREIKATGGLTLVQDPDTAEYDGMPRSAVKAGVADFVAPIAAMPDLLIRYAGHPFIVAPETAGQVSEEEPAAFHALLRLLRSQTGHDFSGYRPATLNRRIRRRMGLAQVQTMQEYLDRLRADREEVHHLAGDLLIGVTRFFRDPESWDLLTQTVIAPLVRDLDDDMPLRIWVAGCSTGEEAVSAAILLLETFELFGKEPRFQIFATDIDQRAVDTAREAAFPATITADVQPERLARHFTEENGRYVLGKRLRDHILFARQDLLSDPPFSKLDLIICRNVMIYLDSLVQSRILRMFHFALKRDGCLFLGSSETVGKQSSLYATLSKEWRIYRCVGEKHSDRVNLSQVPLDVQSGARGIESQTIARMQTYRQTSIDVAKNAMISRFVPASILVNQRNDAIYFHGPVRDYLDFPAGEPTRDVTLMALDGLRTRMRQALRQAFETCEVQTATAHRMRRNGKDVAVRITADPVRLQSDQWAVILYLEDIGDVQPVEPAVEIGPDEQSTIQRLEFDLQITRDELTSAVEQLEASNEELRASNEEVMSMNEELQSSNEELETSREELQSLNEELSTVNNQLENKIVELERVNNDISNLINSTQLAVLFLDKSLVIRRFTPSAAELLRILDTDIGRPISDLSTKVNDDSLYGDVEACMATLATRSAHVSGTDNSWFHRQVLPYRTTDNRIEGVLITYTDITDLFRETELRGIRERQQRAVADLGRIALSDAPLPFLFDAAARYLVDGLNCPMAKVLRHRPDRRDLVVVAQRGFRDGEVNVTAVPDGPESQGGYTLTSRHPVVVTDLPNETRFQGPALLTIHGVKSGVSVVVGSDTDPWGVIGVHATEVKRFSDDDVAFVQAVANVVHGAISNHDYKQQLLENSERLRLALEAGRIATWNWDPRSDLAQWDDRLYTMLGLRPGEIPPSVEKFFAYIHPDDREFVLREQTSAVERGEVFDVEFRVLDSSGQERWLVSKGKMFTERAEGPRLIGLTYEITELKKSSTRLATLLAELDHRVQNMLTVMGSIVNLADKEEHVASFKANLRQRLLSLARTHSMLSHAQFDGASLRTRIVEECAPYSGNMLDRIRFEGRDIRLNPQAAQTLGMAIHELVTNCLKYGALSTEDGVISTRTEMRGDRVLVEWQESGGPPVAPPSEFGFGMRVIRDLVQYELDAKVELDFRETGLVCRFDLPLDAVEHSLE